MITVIQYVLYLAILIALAIPLGAYMKKVMCGEKTILSKVLTPCEHLVYRVMRVDKEEQMTWKKYAVSVLMFSGVGLVFLFLLQLAQGVLPGNPQGLPGVKWDLAFNTSASFVTNTNWQAYSGESTLSYLTQALGLTVQNFVSAATGIAVLFALIRGFVKVKAAGLGSFWVDLTRIVIHILLPLNLVISLLLDGVQVIQNIRSWSNLPIIVISARSEDNDKIEALDAGADDYLTKPFSVEELLARLRVTQRRLSYMTAEMMAASSVFVNGKLKVDYAGGCAYLDGQELHLTPIEYKLLCLLSKNVGKVLTHTFITQNIWGRSWENDIASLRVFMATLRKKLEPTPDSPQYIQTHIGVGYRMMKVE